MSEPSGIEIRELVDVAQVYAAAAVLAEVWRSDRQALPAQALRALQHSGNYVVGVYDGERMVGASAGWFGPPAERTMHSHVTGVLPEYQGRGVGRVLKQHQRDWAFERGVGRITWTFDPLIARNAHFTLRVLGARVTDYLVDQYGAMPDAANRGVPSDRLLVSWALAEPPAATPDGAVAAEVRIPGDIDAMRREMPAAAAAWRNSVRRGLQRHLEAGLRIGGFDDERGYLLVDAD
ncbi:GNAT family N-acetyltransferase [Microbacterium sp. dk485]|uniref:GNAT family N-acetyltransferase n=1 Tax=Microbacterium sp. dk485 TaxID=2560021 RepID=UPI001073D7A0|nr:GNAT family N-acetyltransferase [Microbacterium sp. dk485]TFV84919.1 GNAT family N-acetyltransferase [Microbacterium sp. dk485]